MFTSLLNLILPPTCYLCSRVIESSGLCPSCIGGFRFITGPICPVCGVPFASQEVDDHPCGRCIKGRRPFHKARSIGLYEGGLLETIHSFKYNGKVALARPLGEMMAQAITNPYDYHFIVPIPLHKKRLRERGFNQSLLLAREVGKRFGIQIEYTNLKRIRPTEPQINLKGKERLKNVKGAFAVTDGGVFKGKRILLIDDVYTTGATVSECAKILRKARAGRLDVLTLARVV